jgi:hypothetical protein
MAGTSPAMTWKRRCNPNGNRFSHPAATSGSYSDIVFSPETTAFYDARDLGRVAIQMTCQAPPWDPLARTLTSSTWKPTM